ncbi:MAG: sigma-54-dependent Fis family transcriptional regulator [Candidatus Neomarinimicrobiota bacterium]|nr:MAG: sigma-54-dependent Fis family transcriptional regulator [Candidatus Neomarinimicrobiota bacterium]
METGYDALTYLQMNPVQGIVIHDQLELMSSVDTVKRIQSKKLGVPIWLWVTQQSVDHLHSFLEAGCDRWLLETSPPDILQKLIRDAVQWKSRYPIVNRKRFQLTKLFGLPNLIGSSGAMMQLYYQLERTLNADITVLIQGESGSGKELVARLLHSLSSRSSEKFVGLNCAAIPRDLMESELFGYEKGAFTGATIAKKGKFEYAHKGTLFLDEIADLDLTLQGKILRVLELGEFERIGSNQTRHTDVRILSATNKNLERAVRKKTFRLDLFYRINSFTVEVPPLRDRYGDFLPLLVYILKRSNQKNHRNIQSFDWGVLPLLQEYPWPGNIRQLESFLTQAALYSDKPHLEETTVRRLLEPLRQSGLEAVPEKPSPPTVRPGGGTMEEMERLAILQALEEVGGNVTAAAKKLGLSRVTVWRKMERYKIKFERPQS